MTEFKVEKADTRAKYEGLRDLWVRVFGDEPALVDHVYRVFGAEPDFAGQVARADQVDRADQEKQASGVHAGNTDIAGYVICNEAGRVVSALTCYKAGTLVEPESTIAGNSAQLRGAVITDPAANTLSPDEYGTGKPAYISYAVCTDPEYRGRGLGGQLTEYVKNVVTAGPDGGISLVSPAEESLIAFYKKLGYEETCFASEQEAFAEPDEEEILEDSGWDPAETCCEEYDIQAGADWDLDEDDGPPVIIEYEVEAVDVSTYNMYRERFLEGVPHVAMSPAMLELVRSVSLGGDGMLVVNGGDAVCVVSAAPEPGDEGLGNEGLGNEELGDEGLGDEGLGDEGLGDETHGHEGADGLKRQPLILNELLVSPTLLALSEEIAEEIASGLARRFGLEKIIYRTPAGGRCQSMSSGTGGAEFYFGFPVE